MRGMLIGLWRYRGFIITSIRNEFVSRFSRSLWGGMWMILQPLSQVLIYALVLSAVLRAKLPGIESQYGYAIYLTAGMLGWSLFNEIVNRCLTVFIEQGNLMKKVKFPKVTLPAIVIGSALLNNIMLFVSILVIFAFLGHLPTFHILWLPLLTLSLIMLSIGIGLIAGVINVFVRDVGQVVPILLNIMFWMTPIVYPPSIIPDSYRYFLNFNPLLPIIRGYQDILVFEHNPEYFPLVLITGIALGLMGIALYLFRQATEEMVDVL